MTVAARASAYSGHRPSAGKRALEGRRLFHLYALRRRRRGCLSGHDGLRQLLMLGLHRLPNARNAGLHLIGNVLLDLGNRIAGNR